MFDLLRPTVAGEVLGMSKFDLNEIAENTKQAREATLVGKYDEAVVFYESVIHMINRHVTQTKDQNSKQKWQQVCDEGVKWGSVFVLYTMQYNLCELYVICEGFGSVKERT